MKQKTNLPKITQQNITETLEQNYMPYAMSVIISRAIPEIDGFKPAHRKLLYTMYKMGLLKGSRTKSTNVVGQTMKLNPHGDAAIYETMVRLTRANGALLHPFIDSKGNFGKQYSKNMAYAASRYTEVKLDEICTEIFKDIDKNTVDFVDNYDGELKEPVLLPTTYPNVLVTPNQGIAVGMASNICSFNLREVCEAAAAYIKDKQTDICKYLKAPDFTTGGQLIYNESEIRKIYETGKGSFKVRAKYRYDKKNSLIEIYEIPYTTNVETIIDKIIQLVKSGKIKEINDIRDEIGLDGLKVTIDIKRNADPDKLMHKLYKMTTLEDGFSCNFNILVNCVPMVMGIKEILENWLDFRMGCIKRQAEFDCSKKSDRLHLLEGLEKILVDIDKAIKIIRNTENDADVIPNLMKGFSITQVQAEYIAEIKLRNLNKEYLMKRLDEKNSLIEEIEYLNKLKQEDELVKKVIISELKAVSKKFGKPRMTEIVYESDIEEVSQEHFIEDYPVKVFLTRENYFKKITLVSLRSSGTQKLKEDDEIIQELETSNKAEALFFSDMGNVYKMKLYDIADCKASQMGEYLQNILALENNEQILYTVCTGDYSGDMIFAFENGKAARVPLKCYETKVNRKKLIKGYYEKSPLVGIFFVDGEMDFASINDKQKAVVFSSSLIAPSASKTSAGVQVFKLKKGTKIKKFVSARDFECDDAEYYRASEIPSEGHFILGQL